MAIKKQNTNAFTLLEIIVAIIILGLVAAFGIPNYTKAVNRSEERDVFVNLEVIREGVLIYMDREGSVPPALAAVSNINTTLYLNTIAQGNLYSCAVLNEYTCYGTNPDWQLSFELDNNEGVVHCNGGGCPSCTAASCPY